MFDCALRLFFLVFIVFECINTTIEFRGASHGSLSVNIWELCRDSAQIAADVVLSSHAAVIEHAPRPPPGRGLRTSHRRTPNWDPGCPELLQCLANVPDVGPALHQLWTRCVYFSPARLDIRGRDWPVWDPLRGPITPDWLITQRGAEGMDRTLCTAPRLHYTLTHSVLALLNSGPIQNNNVTVFNLIRSSKE